MTGVSRRADKGGTTQDIRNMAGAPGPARGTVVVAGLIAAIGWTAILIDATKGIAATMAEGHDFAAAAFLYLRYFTIGTNIGVASLMSLTAWRGSRGRPLPAAFYHGGATVYVIVTCITYEAVLRRLWSPQGVTFYTDMTMHDVVPALTLLFWIVCAPKRGLQVWHAVAWLAVPLVYFLTTLALGAYGVPYPYGFLDANKLTTAALARNVVIFLVFFGIVGGALIALARMRTRARA